MTSTAPGLLLRSTARGPDRGAARAAHGTSELPKFGRRCRTGTTPSPRG